MAQKEHYPPKLALRFLHWFLRKDLAEGVEGDLEEQFYAKLDETTITSAKINYWYQVFAYLRPFAIKKSNYVHLNQYAMFQNYLKIGWRNLVKHKIYSSIKVGGFSLGIAACILIFLFIRQELSYDQHYQNGDQIFRVNYTSTFNDYTGIGVHFPSPFASVIEEEFPEIQFAARYNAAPGFGAGGNEIKRADRTESSFEDKLIFADQSLLQILQASFIYGNPENSLNDPNSIVITERKADKFFPDENPLGKILILNNDDNNQYKVTGVIKNFPVTSHFQYDFLISLYNKEFFPGESTNWRSQNYVTYIKVNEGTDIANLEEKMSLLIEKYFLPPVIDTDRADNIAWLKSFQFGLQPVQEIYLNLDEIGDSLSHGDIQYIWLFGAVAIFILLIACINFINLSTAKSVSRAKEVGLRKVVGSYRIHLIKQFLTESTFLCFIAFLAGIVIAALMLPYFNSVLGISLAFPWTAWWLLPGLILGSLIIGIIAGVYPAFYLSSFQPIKVLKGNVSRGGKKSTLRSSLVVFQFSISIVLIVSTLIINQQMDFILTKKLGFDKDQVIIIQGTRTLEDKIDVFKNELLRLPNVTSASISGYLPVSGFVTNNGGWSIEGMGPEDAISGQQWAVDFDYPKTIGLNIKQGRDFSIDVASDSSAVIINEALANKLNFDNPIGEQISNYLGDWTIIGVVEDFHFESLKKQIRPLGMYIRANNRAISVKVNTADMPFTVGSVANLWKQFSPNQSFRYTFLDVHYAKMYKDVNQIRTIFSAFALLAIIVACLGLFALSSFLIEQRRKEVSIRLILGASLNSIFRLLTNNFIVLILLSFFIAIPITWYSMGIWLEDYVYRISIEPITFLIAGILSVLIAAVTISYQAIRATLINPVDNLKSE